MYILFITVLRYSSTYFFKNHHHIKSFRFWSITLCIYFWSIVSLSAQKPPPGVGSGGNIPLERRNALQQNQNSLSDTTKGPDTTIYKYVHVNDIFNPVEVKDTLANTPFLHKISFSNGGEYVSTGNYGAAVMSLFPQEEVNTGFNTGYTQYRYYQTTKDNFKFFEQNRPLSDVYFTQLGNQENIAVGANFSRNFDKGLSISLNYNRLSQRGFYNGQDTKTTSFAVGMRYKSPSERYNAILMFIHNANEEGHTGGIKDATLSDESFRRIISVKLANAATRHQERNISFIQYYKLNSAKNKDWKLYLKNDFSFAPSYYKFSDTNINTAQDTAYYSPWPFLPKGIRRYLDVQKVSNGFYINGEKTKGVAGSLGIIYDQFSITDSPTKTSRTDLTAVADGKIPIKNIVALDVKGKLGLGANIGTFDFMGGLGLNLGKIAQLYGSVKLFSSEPQYRMTHLNINNEVLQDTSLSNPFGTIISGALTIPSIHLKATLNQSVVSNPIYWPAQQFAQQFDGVFTLSQLHVSHKLSIKRLHFDNDLYFQLQSNDLLPLPNFFSTHQLYYGDYWFKKALQINIGLDARMIPEYKGPAYHPLYGAYQLSDTTLPFFPAANFFITAQISAFRAMFVMENFSQYWIDDQNFDVVGHPQNDPVFRMCFQWLLKD